MTQFLVETSSFVVAREQSTGTAMLSSSTLDDLLSSGPESGLCCLVD